MNKIIKCAIKKTVAKSLIFILILGLIFSSGTYVARKVSNRAKADSSVTSVSVGNSLPVVTVVTINSNSNITLTENTTTTVTITATITDNNGCTEITVGGSVNAVLYRSSVAGGTACTPDNNNCYSISLSDVGGTCTGAADPSYDVTGNVSMQFFADSTDAGAPTYSADTWKARVTANDGTGNGTGDEGTAVEVNTLNALNVAATINYGSMGLGSDSGSSPQTATVTNTGNNAIDPQLSSISAMSCDTGTIPVANQKYAAATFTYSSGGTALSGTPTTLNLNLPKPTSTTPVTADSYWGILIPSSSVSGGCAGANTFTAVAG